MAGKGLQTEESETFQRTEAVVQRVGWAAMALFVVLALVGVLGGFGPVASVRATSGPLSMDYQRFARYTASTDLTLTLDAAAVRDGQAVITLSSSWVDDVDIQRITPQPDSSRTGSAGLQLTFTAGSAPLGIRVSYRPDALGATSGSVTDSVTGSRLVFDQFVYP